MTFVVISPKAIIFKNICLKFNDQIQSQRNPEKNKNGFGVGMTATLLVVTFSLKGTLTLATRQY